METFSNKTYDEERAFYGKREIKVMDCNFDGPADGESAFKECVNLKIDNCFFNLRYPFWHCTDVCITSSEMTELCRAALWYSGNIKIDSCKLKGVKALRECKEVKIFDCEIISPEFGWKCSNIKLKDCDITGEYIFLNSQVLRFENLNVKGKYSYQYVDNAYFKNCNLDTKDAFWHGKDIRLLNCTIKGEYLGWYSENLTLENCRIIGTQPFCYCKNLKLINCTMEGTDLAFEKSTVEGTVISHVESIKNPLAGKIEVKSVGEIIIDDPTAMGKIHIIE